jgi:hypothetical protein
MFAAAPKTHMAVFFFRSGSILLVSVAVLAQVDFEKFYDNLFL